MKGEFEHFLKGVAWLALILHFLGDQKLFFFEIGDLVFIGVDDARVVRFDNAIQQLIDLLIDLSCLMP